MRSETRVTPRWSRLCSASLPIRSKPPLPRLGQRAAVAVVLHRQRRHRLKVGIRHADSIAHLATLRSAADLAGQLRELPHHLVSAAAEQAAPADSRVRAVAAVAAVAAVQEAAAQARLVVEQAGRCSYS